MVDAGCKTELVTGRILRPRDFGSAELGARAKLQEAHNLREGADINLPLDFPLERAVPGSPVFGVGACPLHLAWPAFDRDGPLVGLALALALQDMGCKERFALQWLLWGSQSGEGDGDVAKSSWLRSRA